MFKKLKLIINDAYCDEEIQGGYYNQAHIAVKCLLL